MRQLLVIVSLFFLMINLSYAQGVGKENGHGKEGKHPKGEKRKGFGGPLLMSPEEQEEHKAKIIEHLDEAVHLTTSQKTRISAILDDTNKKLLALKETEGPQYLNIQEKIKNIKESELSKEEKRERMKALKDEIRPQMNELKEKLHLIKKESKQQINQVLTTEQKARLYELKSEHEDIGFEKRKGKPQR